MHQIDKAEYVNRLTKVVSGLCANPHHANHTPSQLANLGAQMLDAISEEAKWVDEANANEKQKAAAIKARADASRCQCDMCQWNREQHHAS